MTSSLISSVVIAFIFSTAILPAISVVLTCIVSWVYAVFCERLKLVPLPNVQVLPSSREYSQVELVSKPERLTCESEVIKSIFEDPVSVFKAKVTSSLILPVIVPESVDSLFTILLLF